MNKNKSRKKCQTKTGKKWKNKRRWVLSTFICSTKNRIFFFFRIGLALVNDGVWLCAACSWWPRSLYVAHSTYWILSYYNYSIAAVHVTIIKSILFAKSQIAVTIGISLMHVDVSTILLLIIRFLHNVNMFCQKNMSFENLRSGYFILLELSQGYLFKKIILNLINMESGSSSIVFYMHQ